MDILDKGERKSHEREINKLIARTDLVGLTTLANAILGNVAGGRVATLENEGAIAAACETALKSYPDKWILKLVSTLRNENLL